MALNNVDPELLTDFLTESGELLDQLDKDLVVLESSASDPELLNQVFRALHTIKGSASFLALTNLVAIAHAAESALNAARNRVIVVDRGAMDLLLSAVDTIKKQFVDLREGHDLSLADPAVVAGLTALGEGRGITPGAGGPAAAATPAATSEQKTGEHKSGDETPLTLPPGKADLLEFLVADVDQTLEMVRQQVASMSAEATRESAASALSDVAEAMSRSVEFFEFAPMSQLVGLLKDLAAAAPNLTNDMVPGVVDQAQRVVSMLTQQAQGLARQKLVHLPVDEAREAFHALLKGQTRGAAAPAASGVKEAATGAAPAEAAAQAGHPPAGGPAGAQAGAQGATGAPGAGDQTIRVEVKRLEALLNLVGELVLQKNRVSALSRQLVAENLGDQTYRESVTMASSNLDRVTSDLQVAVMKTRMQPLEKIFGKYPRLIRDLARKLNKNIQLDIVGGETEVDKSVIEELGDPLIHLMRNSADHGIEMPADRKAAGKSEAGTIRLVASHEGSHVQILIQDDGRGLQKERIKKKALEKKIHTQAELDQMSDKDIYRIIFAAGFSTADQISDVSGRGVGMDVVRTNIEKLKGVIELTSDEGKGTTVAIKIPLTVAIMSAMMVGVGDEVYAVPLSNVVEIVKPTSEQLASIRQSPVMRLRDGVLPLVNAGDLFRLSAENRGETPFAVVLSMSEKRIGLLVSRLIGQQEIVIKPLDEYLDRNGPVSGATVRDDGGVSLIVDVARLFQHAESRRPPTGAAPAGRAAGPGGVPATPALTPAAPVSA